MGGGTFTAAVNFACQNLPALTGCTFIPPTITAGSGATPVTLTIATAGPNQGPELRKTGLSVRHRASSEGPRSPRAGQIAARATALTWLLAIPMAGMLLIAVGGRRISPTIEVAVYVAALISLALLAACGGLGGGAGGGSGVTVSVSPPSISLLLGGQQQFTATVINGGSQTVNWSASMGTIDSTGLYVAPTSVATPTTASVTATSVSNPSASGSATVTLTGPTVTVSVSPVTAALFANEAGNNWPVSATQQQFSATVTNGTSQTVTWAVTGGSANGTIDSTGLYSAPANVPNPAAVIVTATSTLTTSPGTATVAIQSATPVGTYSNIQGTATATGGVAHNDQITLTVH